jgi:farnesyl-diphosphate farnesyltransferase
MVDLFALLAASSRTFALTIPLLSEPLRTQAMLAYLLLRIADTVEDADAWSVERRLEGLESFAGLLQTGTTAEGEAFRERLRRDPPTRHAGYLRLLEHTPEVLAALNALPVAQRDLIAHHTRLTIEGMAATLERIDPRGRLVLRDLAELRRYCYFVAGLVGELLTELFLLAEPALATAAAPLRAGARWFGEGLQLTNILKDADDDARQGRLFLPPDVPRAQLLALARSDLKAAAAYAQALFEAGASKPLWAFAALPIRLATATLDAVERNGPGAKVSRTELTQIVGELDGASAPAAFLANPT